MDEATALQSLRRRDEDALAWFIRRYTPYVGAVASGILGPAAFVRDKEEICADVFFALWQNADSIDLGKVKDWLSAAARNKARDRLRKSGRELPLEEDVLLVADGANMARDMEEREQAAFLRRALLSMAPPDWEIFLRHYYYGQTLTCIAGEMGMNLSTVKTRLRRGRVKLKDILRKGGYTIADADL